MKEEYGKSEEQHLLVKLENGKQSAGDGDGDGDGNGTVLLFFTIFISVCGSFVCGCAVSPNS